MFKDAKGDTLKSVPIEAVSPFHPKGISQDRTLEALNFTCEAADKRVAHLTMGGSMREEEIQLYSVAAISIHSATSYHLYERLGLPRRKRIITDTRRSNQGRSAVSPVSRKESGL